MWAKSMLSRPFPLDPPHGSTIPSKTLHPADWTRPQWSPGFDASAVHQFSWSVGPPALRFRRTGSSVGMVPMSSFLGCGEFALSCSLAFLVRCTLSVHPFPMLFALPLPNAVPTNTTCTLANATEAANTSTLFASVKKASAPEKNILNRIMNTSR